MDHGDVAFRPGGKCALAAQARWRTSPASMVRRVSAVMAFLPFDAIIGVEAVSTSGQGGCPLLLHGEIGFAAATCGASASSRADRAGRAPTPPRRARAARHRPAAASASGASDASPELPIAISTLRTKRSRPVRLIGGLGEQRAECRVVEPRQLGELAARAASSRAASFASRPACANLFHGQTARQSSQP